jgi:hypothetical protein
MKEMNDLAILASMTDEQKDAMTRQVKASNVNAIESMRLKLTIGSVIPVVIISGFIWVQLVIGSIQSLNLERGLLLKVGTDIFFYTFFAIVATAIASAITANISHFLMGGE